MKLIKISLVGTPDDYLDGITPLIINQLGYSIAITHPMSADLIIYGPFYKKQKDYRFLPKPIRKIALEVNAAISKRKFKAVSLLHTSENVRHDFIDSDYSISFDLPINSRQHRSPYWMEMLDWAHEGLTGNCNRRFGKLLSIQQMLTPLGNQFLTRSHKAAFISSHLHEPRKSLLSWLSKFIEIDGFGPAFNHNISNHNESNFTKYDLLQRYAFNLCPENGIYPGYYTEKVPEAFAAGCLPIAWADTNIKMDFNPLALINLEPMVWNQLNDLDNLLRDRTRMKDFAEQPLLLQQPSLEPLKNFIKEIILSALS